MIDIDQYNSLVVGLLLVYQSNNRNNKMANQIVKTAKTLKQVKEIISAMRALSLEITIKFRGTWISDQGDHAFVDGMELEIWKADILRTYISIIIDEEVCRITFDDDSSLIIIGKDKF